MLDENSNYNDLCLYDGKEGGRVCVSVPNIPACCGMHVVSCPNRVVYSGCECCKCSKCSLDFIKRICQATVQELAKRQVAKERYSVFDGGSSLDSTPEADGRGDFVFKKQKYRSDSSSNDGKSSPRRKLRGEIRKRQTSKDSKGGDEIRRRSKRKQSEVLKKITPRSGNESDDEYEPASKARKGIKGTRTPSRNSPDGSRQKPSDGISGKPRKSEEFVQKKAKDKRYEPDDGYEVGHETGKGKKDKKIKPNDTIDKQRGKPSDGKKTKPKISEEVDEKKMQRKGKERAVLKSSGSELSESLRKIPKRVNEGSKGNGKKKIDADDEKTAKRAEKVRKGKAAVYDTNEEELSTSTKKEKRESEKGSKASKKGKEIIDEKPAKKTKSKLSFERIMPAKKLKDSTIGKIEKSGNQNSNHEKGKKDLKKLKSETYEILPENKSTDKRAKIDKKEAIDDFGKEKFVKKPERKSFIPKKGKEDTVPKISIKGIPKKGKTKIDPIRPKIAIEEIPKIIGNRKSPDQKFVDRSGSKFSKREKPITPNRSNESDPENDRIQRNKVVTNIGPKSKSDKILGEVEKKKILGKSNENIGRESNKSQQKVGKDRVPIYSSRIQKRSTRSPELSPERISRKLKYWTLPTRFDNIHISDFMRMRLEVSDLRRTGDTDEICRESPKPCIPVCEPKRICTPCNDCGPGCPQKADCLCCYCL